MNNIEKENLRKKIRNLINQIEEKKVIYKKKLDSAQKSDKELEEIYLEINKLIEDVNKLNEELQKLNGET